MIKIMNKQDDLQKRILETLDVDKIIKDILAFSREYISNPKNRKSVINYLNKKGIGLSSIHLLSAGLLPPGVTTIIPRAALIPKIKHALNGVNNALIFPSYKNPSVDSFLGILRNTIINAFISKHIIWKLKNDGNRFFHWGSYPDSVILTEGITDKLRLMQADLPSIPTNGTEFNIYSLKKEFQEAKEIALFLDGDLAGRIKTLELVFHYVLNKKNFPFDLTVIKAPKDLDPCDLSEDKVKELHRNREIAEDYFKKIIKNSLSKDDAIQLKILRNIEKQFERSL